MKPSYTLDHRDPAYPPLTFSMTRGLVPGERVHLCTASFRLFLHTEFDSIDITDETGQTLGDAMRPLRGPNEARPNTAKKSLMEFEVQSPVPTGSRMTVQLVPTEGMINLSGDMTWDLRLSVIDEEEYTSNICRFPYHDVANPIELYITASSPTGVQVNRKWNGEWIARLVDQGGVTAQCAGESAKLEQNGLTTEVAFSNAGIANGTLSIAEPQPVSIRTAQGFTATSNPLPVLSGGEQIFFGDIHWHTAFSTDGQREMERSLRSCRDELALDFAGPSDHVLREGDYGRSTVHDQAEIGLKFEEPGRFAVIPGFELSRRYGHCNVYTDSWEKLFQLADQFEQNFCHILKANPDRFCIEELVEHFEDDRTLIIPHHSNMRNEGKGLAPDGRPPWCAFRWPKTLQPQHLRLIEMNQQRGAFESEIPDPLWQPPFWKQFHGGLGGSAQQGLAQRHRIGFIGGTDNHNGWPTLEGHRHQVGGITGVIAGELTAAGIHSALHARHCYATTGARIAAQARMNGHLMGSELLLEPSDNRLIQVEIHGTASLERVEVISFGQVAHRFEVKGDSHQFIGEWNDNRPERPVEDVYYYIRARQVDGQCIWLSPWWVDLQSSS